MEGVEVQVMTFDDGSEAECIVLCERDGEPAQALDDVELMATLQEHDEDAYHLVMETARAFVERTVWQRIDA